MKLSQRITRLEKVTSTAPMLVLTLTNEPTPEQQAQIDQAQRTGRRVLAFCEPGNTAWMPGVNLPPWLDTPSN